MNTSIKVTEQQAQEKQQQAQAELIIKRRAKDEEKVLNMLKHIILQLETVSGKAGDLDLDVVCEEIDETVGRVHAIRKRAIDLLK